MRQIVDLQGAQGFLDDPSGALLGNPEG